MYGLALLPGLGLDRQQHLRVEIGIITHFLMTRSTHSRPVEFKP